MCETLINLRVIAALVASAAFVIGIPNQLVADDTSGDGSKIAKSCVGATAVCVNHFGPPQDASTPPVGEAPVSGVPQAGPAPQQPSAREPTQLIRPGAMPHYSPPAYSQPTPTVIQPAPVRRIVRRAPPANATQPFRRVRPEAPPSGNFSLLGVGFGF
jgi:hypothetical protein